MKHTLRSIALLVLVPSLPALAQCPNDNFLVAGSLTPPGVGQTTTFLYQTGQYVLANVLSGAMYTITTCNNTTTDTQISVYDNATGTFIAYNDDFCGLQSQLQFTATSCGVVRVVLDEFSCAATGVPVNVAMTQNSAGSGNLTITPSMTPASCGNNGAVSLSVTGGSGPYTYAWSPGNYTSSSVNNLAPGTYNIIVTDPSHCGQVSVTVPNTGVSATASTTPFSCSGGGSATVSASGGNGPYTYLWAPGGQTTPTINGLAAGTYTCTIHDVNNCTFTISCVVANSSPMTVTAVANPPQFSCGGSSQITSTCNYTSTFVWQPSSSLSNPNIANPVATPTQTTTYTVTATSTCGTVTQTVTITVDTANLFAEGLCLVTVDQSLNKAVLVWERTQAIQNGSYDIFKETPASSGNYVLLASQPVSQLTKYTDMSSDGTVAAERYELRTTNTCAHHSTLSLPHRSMRLHVSPGSGGTWNLIWNRSEGFSFNLYNIWRGTSPTNLVQIASVQSNVQNYTDLSPPPGNLFYAVEAVHPVGCTATNPSTGFPSAWSNIDGTNPAGVAETTLLNSFVIHPNPGHGDFMIGLEMDQAAALTITVSDALGREVHAETFDAPAGMFSRPLNMGVLPAGIYLVRISGEKGSAVQKLVIE